MSSYRRHFPRAANPPVILEVPSDQGPVRVPVRDLSAGGARVTVTSTMPVGAELDLRVGGAALGDAQPLSLRARVLRIQRTDGETDLAVEFVDRIETSSSRLQALVEALRRGDAASAAGARTIEAPSLAVPAPPGPAAAASEPPAEAAPPPRRPERDRLHRELTQVQDELVEQVERGDRAEAELQLLRQELTEERERRQAAERTLVTLQSELSRVRSERRELERLRAAAEASVEASGSSPSPEEPEDSDEKPADLVAADAAPRDPDRERSPVLLGPDDIGSRVVFARHLREGARLRPTARFARFEPVSRLDIRVHDFARRSDQLAGIRELAARRVSEEDILRVLFAFFERGLLRLEPSSPSAASDVTS